MFLFAITINSLLSVITIINCGDFMTQTQKLYLTETEATGRYGYSRQWYQRQRWLGTGPKFIKVNGGRVLYPIKETDSWFSNFGLQNNTCERQQNEIK